MHKIFKRGGAVLASAVTAMTVLLVAGSPASASNPGESYTWSPEQANGQTITSSDTIDEARDPHNGNLIEVWRSNNDNAIWVSLNHGPAIQLPTAQTYAAPRVAWYGGHFHVFHTGLDGAIYTEQLAFSSSTALASSQPSAWTALPHSAVSRNNLSPSVISFPLEHDNDAMISWGSATDDLQYTMYWNGYSWENPIPVPYVRSSTANTLAWNDIYDEISMTHRGLDGQAYISYQVWGNDQWSTPEQMPAAPVTGTPVIAWANNGQGTMAVTADGTTLLNHLNRPGQHDDAWSYENTYTPAAANPQLESANNTIFLILTRRDTHGVYYKAVTVFSP